MVEEYCWAITLTAGLSRCGRSRLNVLELGFQMEYLFYGHIFSCVCALYHYLREVGDVPELLGRNNCLSLGVNVYVN